MKKKLPKKRAAKKKAVKKVKKKAKAKKPAPKTPKAEKPIGAVTHFYTAIKVAIVKFKVPVKVGTVIRYKGATTDFEEKISSMQFDHKPVMIAKKGKLIGIKVKKRVREGDKVYKS